MELVKLAGIFAKLALIKNPKDMTDAELHQEVNALYIHTKGKENDPSMSEYIKRYNEVKQELDKRVQEKYNRVDYWRPGYWSNGQPAKMR